MKLNIKTTAITTHEGATAYHINSELQLRRSVLSCMLWEDTFYEDGQSVIDRIAATIPLVDPAKVAAIAVEARTKQKLRHVPLLIAREMAKLTGYKAYVSSVLHEIIQRPDELTEFLAIYWKDKRQPLSAQVKRGLALAFNKFNEYQLGKYNRHEKIKLRDALFLCHAKPQDEKQADLWKRLIEDKLEIPDTWEVEISASKDKKESWSRLLSEKKLGALALLRNLRNMIEAKVEHNIIKEALLNIKIDRVLPFRFIAAAKYALQFEPEIEQAMLKCLTEQPKLSGKTALVIDGSGSMFGTKISAKSELDRFEAAAALCILARELCEDSTIIVFSNNAYLVPSRHGFALRDAIYGSAERSGTNTQYGIMGAAQQGYDRIIVFTDEQSHQSINNPLIGTKGYFVNVATYKNGIGYGRWVHIDGWSEAIFDFIIASEVSSENE
jgi:60 kDa SS-A/Ro ribonucleoprotein